MVDQETSLHKLLDRYLIKDMIDEVSKYINPITKLMIMYTFNEDVYYNKGRRLIIEHLTTYNFDYNLNKNIIKFLQSKNLWDYKIFQEYYRGYTDEYDDGNMLLLIKVFIRNFDTNNINSEILLRLGSTYEKFNNILINNTANVDLHLLYSKIFSKK